VINTPPTSFPAAVALSLASRCSFFTLPASVPAPAIWLGQSVSPGVGMRMWVLYVGVVLINGVLRSIGDPVVGSGVQGQWVGSGQ